METFLKITASVLVPAILFVVGLAMLSAAGTRIVNRPRLQSWLGRYVTEPVIVGFCHRWEWLCVIAVADVIAFMMTHVEHVPTVFWISCLLMSPANFLLYGLLTLWWTALLDTQGFVGLRKKEVRFVRFRTFAPIWWGWMPYLATAALFIGGIFVDDHSGTRLDQEVQADIHGLQLNALSLALLSLGLLIAAVLIFFWTRWARMHPQYWILPDEPTP